MNSFNTNYILNNDKNNDQNAIPFQIMPCYSYPASLMNQKEIHIQRVHLALIMSSMSMKMLANMAHMQYHLRLQLSCKFGESIWNPFWLIMLTNSSDSNYVPNEHKDADQYDPHGVPSEILPC